jgi:outer membrane protein assembly factor BamB
VVGLVESNGVVLARGYDWCPTSAGDVAAVSSTDGRVLWEIGAIGYGCGDRQGVAVASGVAALCHNGLAAIDVTSGRERWHSDARCGHNQIAADGALFAADYDQSYALNAIDGTERWRTPFDGKVVPVAASAQTVLYAIGWSLDDATQLVAMDTVTGLVRWRMDISSSDWVQLVTNETVAAVSYQRWNGTEVTSALVVRNLVSGVEMWSTRRNDPPESLIIDLAASNTKIIELHGNGLAFRPAVHDISTGGEELSEYYQDSDIIRALPLGDGVLLAAANGGVEFVSPLGRGWKLNLRAEAIAVGKYIYVATGGAAGQLDY